MDDGNGSWPDIKTKAPEQPMMKGLRINTRYDERSISPSGSVAIVVLLLVLDVNGGASSPLASRRATFPVSLTLQHGSEKQPDAI